MKNPSENIFVSIIETANELSRSHYEKKRSKLDKIGYWMLVTGCILAVIGVTSLYLIYALFPDENSATTAKAIAIILSGLGMIVLLLSVLINLLEMIWFLISRGKLTESFANRARADYPLLIKQYRRLSCKFSEEELRGFIEWADSRIKLDLKITAFALALIAASPKIREFSKHLKKEILSIFETGESGNQGAFDIQLFPISFESIAFFIVVFALIIQLLSIRWGRVHFFAQFAANRIKETRSAKS